MENLKTLNNETNIYQTERQKTNKNFSQKIIKENKTDRKTTHSIDEKENNETSFNDIKVAYDNISDKIELINNMKNSFNRKSDKLLCKIDSLSCLMNNDK